MTGTVFGSPWLQGLLSDAEIAARLGPDAQMHDMLQVEAAYARAKAAVGQVPEEIAGDAAKAILAFTPDLDLLAATALRDGMPVPGLVAQLRAALPEALHGAVHGGLTSQDVMDTALVLALRDVCDLLEARLGAVITALKGLSERFGAAQMMGMTRMQPALPITVRDRLRGWQGPLPRHLDRLTELRPRLLRLQLGGPVGTGSTLGGQRDAIAAHMAAALDLAAPDSAWHVERDALVEFGGWLAMLTGSLGKIGQDVALMAQSGPQVLRLASGGASSAMAHKTNPVDAEMLVTLARFNAAQLTGLTGTLLHEQERSGAAWTLEWMLLPQMMLATGAALSAAGRMVSAIESIGTTRA